MSIQFHKAYNLGCKIPMTGRPVPPKASRSQKKSHSFSWKLLWIAPVLMAPLAAVNYWMLAPEAPSQSSANGHTVYYRGADFHGRHRASGEG